MRVLLVLILLLLSAPVSAQEPKAPVSPDPDSKAAPAASGTAPKACEGGTCVADEDLAKFIELARDAKCLKTTEPTFKLDPVTIVVDKSGRVFYSGAKPHPYTVHMNWCNYDVTAEGQVEVVAAMMTPDIWGFRFRPKAYIGVLPGEVFYLTAENAAKDLAGEKTNSIGFSDVWDAGVMVDFFHYDWFNLNAAVGFRSFGAGLGADLTENFGAYVGYANTWGKWHHNVNLGLWFSFWNPD